MDLGEGRVEMLDIVCFYWQGKDRPGWGNTELGVKYVNRLYNGVTRNLSLPHRFHCFHQNGLDMSGLHKSINAVPFSSSSWMGCFPKFKAFDPSNGFVDRVIVMDLDIVVTGSLDEMFAYDGEFMTRSTFRGMKQSGGDIVFFQAGAFPFWQRLCNNTKKMEKEYGGRERFLYRQCFGAEEMDFVQDLYPGQLLSYKNHIRKMKRIPKNCRLVSCHGNPRPHELENTEIGKYWKEA